MKAAASLESSVQYLGLLFARLSESTDFMTWCTAVLPGCLINEGKFWGIPLKCELNYTVFVMGSSKPGCTDCPTTGLLALAHGWNKERVDSERGVTYQPEFASHSCPILCLLQWKLFEITCAFKVPPSHRDDAWYSSRALFSLSRCTTLHPFSLYAVSNYF